MRESPSGSGLVTDVRNIFLVVGPTNLPGNYFAALSFGAGAAEFVPESVPPSGSELSLISYGVQPRSGRIWRARLLSVTNTPKGNRRVPTILQWFRLNKDGGSELVGNAVAVPWEKSLAPASTPDLTALQNIALDFGRVVWNAGDVIGLHAVLGNTDVGTPDGWTATISYENVYAQRSPLSGP